MGTRRPPPHQAPHCFSPHIAGVAAALILAALHAPPLTTFAQEQPPPWLLCGAAPASGKYKANTTYQANINQLSATLPKNTSSSPVLYATGSAGSSGPDVVYALALCRGDANASACDGCVADAFDGAQEGCPLYKDVMVFYDLCQLRFSNRNFFLDDDDYTGNTYIIRGSQLVSTPPPGKAFDAAVRLVVNAAANYAAENSSRRFGTGEGFHNTSSRIYALAQCTPDKTANICRTCLTTIANQLPTYFSGFSGGGIFGAWCSFRYELSPFFSGRPLLQLPAFVWTPPLAPAPAPALPAITSQEKTRNKTGTVLLAILIPITIAAMLAISVICFRIRRRSAAQSIRLYTTSSDGIQEANDLLLDLSVLRVATQNFAECQMLGKGGFGMVYKGVLPDGQHVAVKRLCQTSRQGIGELKSELVLVAKLHHKNLVRLIGVCLQEHEKILVYEYMPNRSLDAILFDPKRNNELDWGKRLKIISGVARGLQYLHEDSQLKIVHRDLKASNILLDSSYAPKISDFGLAKIFGGDQSKYVTLRVAGTYGYMAPEYAMRGLYSIKSDVFSFGVLVLEIVTGRRNGGSCNTTEQGVDLINTVWEHWTRGDATDLVDPSLRGRETSPAEQNQQIMLKCLHIGLLCVQRKPSARPTMSWVNVMLSSGTAVCLSSSSLPRSAFFIQEVSVADDSSASTTMHSTIDDDASITQEFVGHMTPATVAGVVGRSSTGSDRSHVEKEMPVAEEEVAD